MAKSTFTKGSSTFICTSCNHNTRNTGDQAVGSKLCPICWDLAGYENMVQDGMMESCDGAHVTSLFLELKAKRTEEGYAKALKSNDLLSEYFPADDADDAELPAAEEAPTAVATARNGAVAICRQLFKSNPSIDRKAFVAAAIILGVCKATAGTQYNRIKKEEA